jgi:hypothetical protein
MWNERGGCFQKSRRRGGHVLDVTYRRISADRVTTLPGAWRLSHGICCLLRLLTKTLVEFLDRADE